MLNKIQNIYNEVTGRNDMILTEETEINDSLNMTSFGVIQFVCALEDEFDIEFSNSEIKDLKSVSDLIEIIEKSKN